jgi:hypothetical protein
LKLIIVYSHTVFRSSQRKRRVQKVDILLEDIRKAAKEAKEEEVRERKKKAEEDRYAGLSVAEKRKAEEATRKKEQRKIQGKMTKRSK